MHKKQVKNKLYVVQINFYYMMIMLLTALEGRTTPNNVLLIAKTGSTFSDIEDKLCDAVPITRRPKLGI